MRIGVCQLEIAEGKPEENMAKIDKSMEKNSTRNLDLICFPELCIVGYDFEMVKEGRDEKKFFSELAKKYKKKIFAGISIKEKNDFYDVAVIWDEQGNELLEYKKIHLWGDERDFFKNGEKIKVVSIDGYKIGVMICADLGFAELPKIMALKGCDIILCPAAWSLPNESLLKLMSRARAAENQCYVVTINRAKGDTNLCGNSCICNPNGDIIANSCISGDDYIEAVLDRAEVVQKRKDVPWLTMRMEDIYLKNN